jgi:hypothetical protein
MRTTPARYDPRGVVAELDATVPLEEGEAVMWEGRVRLRKGWRQPMGYARLTDRRLLTIRHRLLGADLVTEVSTAEIQGVDGPDASGELTLRIAGGGSLGIAPFSWGEVVGAAARTSLPPRDDAIVAFAAALRRVAGA